MAKMSDAAVPSLLFTETDDASIGTPAAGKRRLFCDTDNIWKDKDEAGTVTAIGGGGGIGAVLFDSTLGAPAANIDTGAGGIAGTHNILEIFILSQTDAAGATDALDITLNNDTGANYDKQVVTGSNTVLAAAAVNAGTAWAIVTHGAGGTTQYPSVCRITIPSYAVTTFYKVGEATIARFDATNTNQAARIEALGYRSTTAISRLKVAAQGAANLKAGTRLLIFGR